MTDIEIDGNMGTLGALNDLLGLPVLAEAFELQVRTLREFHRLATKIAGPLCNISSPPREIFGIEKNFFSTFFLAVTRRLVNDAGYMPLYAMLNQATRACVIACDNILDDEYKDVFAFGFPEQGPRIRSVLTMLLADRVITEFVSANYDDAELLAKTGSISLRALVPSALQECAEEQHTAGILEPEQILHDIHARKTGDLFMAPLALPTAIEDIPKHAAQAAKRAVRSFGLACQIIDDIKDMPDDIRAGKHNLIVSIAWRDSRHDDQFLTAPRVDGASDWTAWDRFPTASAEATALAATRFADSFDALEEIGIHLNDSRRSAIVTCMYSLLRATQTLSTSRAGAR